MNPVETYLHEFLDIRRSCQAVKETSYYGPLANLLNAVGKTLKPRVHCIINLRTGDPSNKPMVALFLWLNVPKRNTRVSIL
jgi:hypothetical protein